ncbi:uncharacterized protein LOC133889976 [Phragmites australis]|uniref:uncharacterized protein LOC133889976 n=1 Tax=Phragmites australis TaxID=29695 RepID=UPI002D7A093E|nr:uncharacterized protein LOC133889976 [Phragmites australis]XP_062186389.1 uncharacterized protein LOC133889976 [Phragmites australis]XP_062186390.1 uncharacterized protein LOC133889976 [Phragmites australis]
MAAEMVGMLGSALAQEGVNGVSSYIASKLEDNASRAHIMARLEMALSQLEFALERTGKLPITYISLLRRMKMFKSAYIEGTDLLNKHKLLVVQDRQQEAGQAVTRYPFLERICRAKNLPISSLLGLNKDYLSASVVQIFEWYATCADKFVTDVESGCPLRRDTFRYPLVRRLLEGKTLQYETVNARQLHSFFIWPVRLEERGVEARLVYEYLERDSPEKRFRLRLMLRISEDTDIVGVAIKCLRSLTSQFKLVTESAVGVLTLLPQLQDISDSYAPPLDWSEESYADRTKLWRPDPLCCAGNAVPSHGVPEPVIAIGFCCYISAPDYILHSSTDSVGINAPPLYLVAGFVPHHICAAPGIVLSYGGKEERVGGSIQQMGEMLRSKAIDCVVRQPEPTVYDLSRHSPHGFARITLRKAGDELAWPKPTAAPARGRSAAKRKRYKFV